MLAPSPDTQLFAPTHPNEVRRIAAWLSEWIAKATRIPESALLSETYVITPAMAEHILDRYNKLNRPLSKSAVVRLAREMRDGRWLLTPHGIVFSRAGNLIDGQHRLAAIVAAGVPVRMNVTFGADPETFKVIDTGLKRGGGHTLAIQGIPHYNLVASAARALYILEERKGAALSGTLPNAVISEIVDRNPLLVDMATHAMRIAKNFKAPPTAALLAFFLIATKSRHADQLDDFVDRLVKGAGLSGPILKLRDLLQSGKIVQPVGSHELRPIVQAATFIKAWNATVTGRVRGRVPYQAGEPFPTVE